MLPPPRHSSVTRPLAVMFFAATIVIAAVEESHAAERDSDAGIEFFEKRIRPVLVEQCYKCHSRQAEEVQGGLLLDTRVGIRKGGDSGAAVTPRNPQESLLLEAIRHQGLEMPPDKKLPDQVAADFETWIKMGAPDPRDGAITNDSQAKIDWEDARTFWSFRPPRRHRPSHVENSNWIRRPNDCFIFEGLESAGLKPSPIADRSTLIRRVTFDLIGLPPKPEQVEAFLADKSPLAYERVVERLLASPRYGERWARLWLDVARYAEDQAHIVGSNSSLFYPNAYLYRDWVIQALNNDLPYDLFIKLQLAADLMQPSQPKQLAALGFVGLGPKYYRRRDPEVMADEWDDRVDTVSRGLLGLTVACARCHDHKYDSFTTEDYYALAGVFASTEMFNRPLDDDRPKSKNGQAKKPSDALHIVRDRDCRDLNVFIRGDVKNKGPLAPRRFLRVLCEGKPIRFSHGSGRLDLAQAIACRDNPLTARVIVNRVWAMHFGRPLVGTPSNFGRLGERPTHPQLLDDLAVRFMESGWSLKWLQREVVTSATYRQSSRSDSARSDRLIGPDNRLLGRMNRRRLNVEAWRDAILSVSGRLDGAVGGKSIQPQNPDERRRTIYSRISRLELDSMLAAFDFPDPNAHSAGCVRTTTPIQKLFVMNSPFMVRQGENLAGRLRSECRDDRTRIQRAYRLLFARNPTNKEMKLGLEFVSADAGAERSQWSQYAQVLLAASEMFMID